MSFWWIPSCEEAKLQAGEWGLDGHSGIWTQAVAAGTRGDQLHAHTQGRIERPKGGKARLYPTTGTNGDTIRTTNPTENLPGFCTETAGAA